MGLTRRTFMFFASALMLTILTACSTLPTFERMSDAGTEYPEEVSSILISADKQKLVFIGKDFHYIFDAPKVLDTLLSQELRPYIEVGLYNFHVYQNNKISGYFTWRLSENTPKELVAKTKQTMGEPYFNQTLMGQRYLGSDMKTISNKYLLTKTYLVKVLVDVPPERPEDSPVSLAKDGAAILLSIPLLPVLPFIIGYILTH